MVARTEQDWLDSVRALVLRGDLPSAQATLTQALAEHPVSVELRRAQAGIFQQTGRTTEAETHMRELLARDAGDTATAFALARLLKDRGRMVAAATAARACFNDERNRRNAELAIDMVELLDDCGRKRDAAAVAEAALTANPDDPRLHAYAGMLAIQLGDFELARKRYSYVLEHELRALEWHVPIGLASTLRYRDASHPDFTLFRNGLQRNDLSDLARAELHFSLGKAHDDVGAYAEAAQHYGQGNALRKRHSSWSRKAWRRAVESRLATRPLTVTAEPTTGFTPVFIVGMLRSGTTLLSQVLARYPHTCNRGELAVLARLAQQLLLEGAPDRTTLQHAASEYARLSRQDDAPDARWFIDKQPLNLRYVDLALALFPDARIIHCRRNPRDNALSLWAQCFIESVHDYAYDFDDIALVMRDGERMMARWMRLYPNSIRAVRYEDLIASPSPVVAELARWIGMPPSAVSSSAATQSSDPISTASLWQARQPIHPRSVDRWKHYAPYIPELLKLPER